MALRSAPLWLLELALVASWENGFSFPSHSMRFFYTSISEPSQGQPHFVSVGYVDGQVFLHYDSNSQRLKSRVSWIEKVEKENPHYRDKYTQSFCDNEDSFRERLEILRSCYNQSKDSGNCFLSGIPSFLLKSLSNRGTAEGKMEEDPPLLFWLFHFPFSGGRFRGSMLGVETQGGRSREGRRAVSGGGFFSLEEMGVSMPPSSIKVPAGRWGSVYLEDSQNHHLIPLSGFHTWQLMHGCEFHTDGSKRGFWQYGYDGRTFITFDKETLTWVAPDPPAQITQRKWDAIPGYNQRRKFYLEVECIELLKKFLSYGKETLKTEPPVVMMSSRTEAENGMETHVCRMDGFYPKEIDASWTRDGEVWLQDTFHGSVAPSADGTYHYWLSIQIDPKERGRYRCHVEHDGLQEPLDLALKVPDSNLGVHIIGYIVAVVVPVCVVAGIVIFLLKKRQEGYKAASRSNQAPELLTPSLSGHSQHDERGEERGSASF